MFRIALACARCRDDLFRIIMRMFFCGFSENFVKNAVNFYINRLIVRCKSAVIAEHITAEFGADKHYAAATEAVNMSVVKNI